MVVSIVLVVLVITGIIGFASMLIKLFEWGNQQSGCARISFDSFKKFYEINPNRWVTRYGTVVCKTYKDIYDDDDVFCFGFFDYCEYRKWVEHQEKLKRNANHTDATKRMMDAVREDIAKAEAETSKLSNKSIDEIIAILCKSNYEDRDKVIFLLEQVKLLNLKPNHPGTKPTTKPGPGPKCRTNIGG